jgi:NAD(P)-dependent dehydrogenase (short-subunit alcohol dehydrogenase family)
MAFEGKPLAGKTALITGGSRGIGAGITRKLASWGCAICINYVDRDGPARKLEAELREQGVQVSLHRADISVSADIERMRDEVAKIHGGLNILVNNAGATKFAKLEEATEAQWQFVQDTNSRSTWLLAKHLVPLLKHQPGARYITVTNSSTVRIIERAGLFAVAKAGMEALTMYLAFELAPYGIVVNCVRPGLVHTDVFKVRPEFEVRKNRELSISPWEGDKMTTPENRGDVVAMLCLDEAAWIAGQIITVDGGYSHWGHRGDGQPRQSSAERAAARRVPEPV